jgi:hypothetical protein
MEWENIARQLRYQNWIILFVLGSASFFFMGSHFTLGLILGGLVIIVNFNLLQNSIRQVFLPGRDPKSGKFSIIAKSYFRLAILGIIIYILVTTDWIDPIGFTLGLSIVVISILCLGIRLICKSSSREAV